MAQSVKSQTGHTAFLFGAGYTARALIPALQKKGYSIYATTRSSKTAHSLREIGVEPLCFEGQITPDIRTALDVTDVMISSIPPSSQHDPVLEALGKSPCELLPQIRYVAYLSATSVYGDRNGQWVFEDEHLYPKTLRGHQRMQAEMGWIESGLPIHIFRLVGIYGPAFNGRSRTPFKKLRDGTARAVIKPDHIVNRIHVTDIVRVIMASLARPNPVRIYNVADGHPAPPQEVLDYAAQLLGLPPPPRINADSPELSDMARSFYREAKRVSPQRIKEELGWKPLYPSYKEGLRACLST